MKKLTAIFMILILIFSSCLFVSAQNTELIKALSLCPDSWSQSTKDIAVTRAELCYTATKLSENSNKDVCDTAFEDVKKDNIYSGYIQFLYETGAVSGVSDTEFNPDGNVSVEAAAKVILSVLGYSGFASIYGGYPNGYIEAASALEILNGVENYDALSQNDLCIIIKNVLISMKNHEVSIVGGKPYYESAKTKGILEKIGLSAYYGILGTVKDGYADFTVQKNYSSDQAVILKEGDNLKVDVSAVSAVSFENAPVILWADEDKKAIYIELQKRYEIQIGFSAEINGQRAENKEFQTSKLESLMLLDDETEYDMENAAVRYNGENRASAPYLNKFVRMVTYDDEVISADFYQLTDGGLISEISSSKIIYNNGRTKNVALSDIDAENLRVYIDGRSASVKEIKTDSVFSYYRNADTLILAVCEKVIVDELNGISEGRIYIGNRYFNRNENIYCAKKGEDFVKGNINDFLGCEIAAYISPDGNVSFIKTSDGYVESQKFYGMVDAYKEKTFDEVVELQMFKIDGAITKDIYKITDKTDFYDGLTLSDIQNSCENSADKLAGECIYVFEAKADKTIKSISKPEAFAGFGESCSTVVSRFENDSTPFVYIGGKYIYFPNENIIAIYEKDGKTAVKYITWGDIYGASFDGTVTVRLYGENQSSKPTLVTLSGSGLNSMYPRVGYKNGFITDKRDVIDENGDEAVEIKMFSKSGEGSYVVKKETGDKLPQMGFIRYQTSLLPFADENIVFDFDTLVTLTGEPTSWPQQNGLKIGTVKELDDARLWVEEGDEIYFLHPYDCFFGKVQSSKNNQIKAVSVNEIHSGDTIVYVYFGGDIKAILSVE